uniref:Link domain-containing protein n=1 Tax=viral metagenome TaxID=1070528 RepID=A0A6C0E294_9ZZZZ
MDATSNSTNNLLNGSINPEITEIYDYVNNILINPSVVIILIAVLVVYLVLFMSLGNSNNDSMSTSETDSPGLLITIIVVAVFIVLAIINGFQYFFGIDVIASVSNLFSNKPEIDLSVVVPPPSPVPEIKLKKQVFNIPGNNYVYPDAKALCTAYGARLASYKEIEDAYNDGAEWCNYGWSDGQMALFPTQQKTYDNLQKIEGHENDCGRPGVNGGYMANPSLRFGVNCYGYKPQMTSQEEELMESSPQYPKTVKDLVMEQRVNYWKNRLTEILVSPFNSQSWSKI